MKTNEQLINNIIGQLNGIKKMITENKKDCFDIITQIKAAKSATNSLMNKFIEENFVSCIQPCDKINKDKIKKLLTELTKSL